ncbi:DUF1090 domain-containing protein [Snodgrassella alvi]|jgi:valyl-tRNA synthetase|uniref:DUF1090 domain-containing protein n=1 Tax=Snodgrassella alvi TaxID=1196083 RepID=A0A855FVY8_9NEIS|nr:DUF1090 domain-containing protein [Snodgrassella alvi]PIT60086.1 hypothetical protein BHC57_07475 [Snodgrassella alvi]
MNYSRMTKSTVCALALAITLPVLADNNWYTCKEKQQQIEKQLQYARANENQNQINRLTSQKTDLAQNCTNEVLRQKYIQKIDKLNNKVNETQHKLAKAQSKGNNTNVENLQNKLNENQVKLQQAKQNFARFEQAAKQ